MNKFVTVAMLGWCGLALGAGSAPAALILPPPPAEASLAALLEVAGQEIPAVLAPGYFDKPAAMAAWPCPVDETALRAWAGVLGSDEQTEKYQRSFKRMLRDMATNLKSTYHDITMVPVSASCKNGKLDGPVEYWFEVSSDVDLPTQQMSNR